MSFFDLFYPPKCFLCRRITGDKGICPSCEEKLQAAFCPSYRTIAVGTGRVVCYSLYQYNNAAVKKLISYIKRNHDKKLYRHLAEKINTVLLQEAAFADCNTVTHVPRTKRSLLQYGFDQAGLLARETAKVSGNKRFQRCLKRARSSGEQKLLTQQERGENAKHMVHFCGKRPPKSILLIDDVITTGSTARACAETLLEHGAEKVVCLFLSRTARKSDEDRVLGTVSETE